MMFGSVIFGFGLINFNFPVFDNTVVSNHLALSLLDHVCTAQQNKHTQIYVIVGCWLMNYNLKMAF